jgi:uncharacterized protein with HEPN domain
MPFFDPAARLEDILAAIRDIEAFTAGQSFDHYMAEPMMRRAVERSVEIVSEASRHVPDDLKARHPQIPWRRIADIGNVLRPWLQGRRRCGDVGHRRPGPRAAEGGNRANVE